MRVRQSVLSLVVLMTLSLVGSVLVLPAAEAATSNSLAQVGEASESRTFEFNSLEDRGEFIHCVVDVDEEGSSSGLLTPSDETCFRTELEARYYADVGELPTPESLQGFQPPDQAPIYNNGLIATHYDGPNFTGASISISGSDCGGGGLTFTGGAWDDRIRSTENGCSRIDHFEDSADFFFGGREEATTGTGGNLQRLDGDVSGVLYNGVPVLSFRLRPLVVAIEVNQAIDAWHADPVPMVSKKATTVRVWIDQGTRNQKYGRLEVRRGGVLLETLIPENAAFVPEGPLPQSQAELELNRRFVNSALNFRPTPELLDGTITFEFISSRSVRCDASNPALFEVGGGCGRTKTFERVPELDVYYIAVESVVDGVVDEKFSFSDLREQTGLINDQLPLAKINQVGYTRLPRSSGTTSEDLLQIAENAKRRDIDAAVSTADRQRIRETVYLAVAPVGSLAPSAGGLASEDGREAGFFVPRSVFSRDPEADQQSRNIGPHEVGHIFGQNHAEGGDFCGGPDGDSYPHVGPLRRAGDRIVPRIAPDGPTGQQVWGFVPRLRHMNPIRAVVDPESSASVMSYCLLGSTRGQFGWADVVTYPSMFEQVELPMGGSPATGSHAYVSGVVSESGDISVREVDRLDAVYVPDSAGQGDFTAQLLDDQGTVVAEVLFEPTELDAGLQDPNAPVSLYYAVPIAFAGDFATVRVVGPDGNTAQISGGESPSVSIPTIGDHAASQPLFVDWSTTDGDSPTVTHAVQYSSDGGVSFVTVATLVEETSFTISAGTLAGADSAQIRIIAQDGTNQVETESNLFSVQGNDPEVSANLPTDETLILSVDGELAVDVQGFDIEDGDLSDTVSFESSLDGPIGIGAEFRVRGDALSVGLHTIVFSVSDSDGNTSSASYQIVVQGLDIPPEIVILEPSSGQTIASTSEAFGLNAQAYDVDDGHDVGPVEWSSDIDGLLGTGETVVVDPASLTTGNHVLTASVTNSEGETVQQSVTVTVAAAPAPPEASDDLAAVEAGATVEIDVLDNDTDPNNNIDETTLSIVTQPTSGTVSVVSTPDGPSLSYQAAANDEEVLFEYEICDSGGLCDQATVTVQVGFAGCTIVGTDGDDLLEGTEADDVICGGEGNDTLRGFGGDDVLRGGPGADLLEGGDGKDLLLGGRGADTLLGFRGHDELYGGRGKDVIDGGRGSDLIHGGKGADQIVGGRGFDLVYGGRGADVISGGQRDDVLRGNAGKDVINGNSGNDQIFGGRGNDDLRGGRGDDLLYGRRGNDKLRGNKGNDALLGGAGVDDLRGGDGNDFCRSPKHAPTCEY